MLQVFRSNHPLRIAQILFFLNSAVWLIFGAFTLLRLGDGPTAPSTMVVIAGLMAGNAAAMLVAGLTVRRPQKRYFFLAGGVLLLNILLSVTDEVGFFDLATMVLDLIILGLLIAGRKNFHRGTHVRF